MWAQCVTDCDSRADWWKVHIRPSVSLDLFCAAFRLREMPDSGNNIWFRFGRKKERERKKEKEWGGKRPPRIHQNFLMNKERWKEESGVKLRRPTASLRHERICSLCSQWKVNCTGRAILPLPPTGTAFFRTDKTKWWGNKEIQKKKNTDNVPQMTSVSVCDRQSKCLERNAASLLKPLRVLSLSFSLLAAVPPDMQS